MKKINKIYTVCDGKLNEIEVIKTTKKFVFIDRVSEFLYLTRIPKSIVCTTPKQAVEREIDKCLSRINSYKDALKKAKEDLQKAKKLLKKCPIKKERR